VTYTTFQQPNCRKFNQLTINRFSKATKKWETDKFAIEKFRNFNGCELKVKRIKPEELFEDQIFELIETSLNFTAKWVIFYQDSNTFPTEELPTDIELSIKSMRMVLRDNQKLKWKLSITHPILDGYKLLLVSKFLPYSMLEKALLPFDPEVWWWLIGFLAVGVVSIIVVSFMREKVKTYVFGSQVRAPLLNIM
jgi:hypothetical protein